MCFGCGLGFGSIYVSSFLFECSVVFRFRARFRDRFRFCIPFRFRIRFRFHFCSLSLSLSLCFSLAHIFSSTRLVLSVSKCVSFLCDRGHRNQKLSTSPKGVYFFLFYRPLPPP